MVGGIEAFYNTLYSKLRVKQLFNLSCCWLKDISLAHKTHILITFLSVKTITARLRVQKKPHISGFLSC